MKMVIGASGFIGKNLYEHFSKREEVLGTYYKNKKRDMIFLDLENPNINKLHVNLKKVDYGFICSAISKIDECKKDEKKAYKINVAGTKKIIKQFLDNGITPVFFSSDFVFNGEKGNYTEKDKTNPCTVYGFHKKEIEDFLSESKQNYLIARISKIFGLEQDDGTILSDWLKKLKNNESIKCATDQIFCPTYIKDLEKAIDLCIEKKLNGLYNIAYPEFYSRFDLANKLKNQLNVTFGRIIPCSIKDFNFLDTRSLNTSLNSWEFISVTGFGFTKIVECISRLEKFIK